MVTISSADSGVSAEAMAGRVFNATLGAFETLSIYVGERLGWYRSLVTDGPATAAELAARTRTQQRYALEWLEMQAVLGILVPQDSSGSGERRFMLPPGAAEALTDEHSLSYLGALPRLVASVGRLMPSLLDAYREGGGVSWGQQGDDAREAQAALNRPWFEQRLGLALESVPDLAGVLGAPGARMADIGCGAGWSTIALARAYPHAQLVGVDIDEPTVAMARANAVATGLTDRVTFQLADAESLTDHGPFDAAFAFECLHDMPQPVEVLAAMRAAVRPGGLVVIMDEAVAPEFSAPGDEVEQIMYGYSLFICLPDGLSSTPSVGTGTVMRQPILQTYARQAGYSQVEVLPITDFSFFRFYRLHR